MTSTQTLIVFTFLLVGAVIAIVYLVSSQLKSLKESLAEKESEKILMEWLKEMKGSVDKSSQSMSEQMKNQRDTMDKQTKMIWERLDNAAKVISGVQKNLGVLEEFGKDMKDLSNVLKSPKLRGGLGEELLYEILENYLPRDLFKTQYKFKDGAVCDAVITLEKGIIPIDSKFSMENFMAMINSETDKERESAQKVFVRDVKKRIDEIASKYILPEEGTTDYAIMYIPSENTFNEITNSQNLRDYAQSKSIALTSPNQFTYFVKTLMMAYRQSELSKHASEILRALDGIQVESVKFGEDLEVLDGHISRTSKSMDNVKTKYSKLTGKLEAVQALGSADSVSTLPELD